MPEERRADRVEKIVRGILAGMHAKATPADAGERQAILAAARLAAAREGYPRMSPAFRRRLARILETGEQPGWLSRRAALVTGIGIAAGALAGTGLGRISAEAPAPVAKTPWVSPPAQGEIKPNPGRWVDVAALTDLPEGQGVRVTAGAVGAFLFRRGDQVSAVSSICSHVPCELKWMPKRGLLNCPCHNANFDPSGNSTSVAYPLPPLPIVHVRLTPAGRVEVLGT